VLGVIHIPFHLLYKNMLLANKNATLTDFQVKTMAIREKELNYFVGLYGTLSGMAAFLAGFAYRALTSHIPEETNLLVSTVFYAITAAAVGLEVIAISNSAFCTVYGPGMALRGNRGLKSMEVAVDVLQNKSEQTLKYFMMGLYGQIISSAILAWIRYSALNALLINMGLAGLCIFIMKWAEQIFSDLYVKKEEALVGQIRAEQVADPSRDIA
jgi:hypothetical protein